VQVLPTIVKKKLYISLVLLISWTSVTLGQNCHEFKKHLESIDSTYAPGHIIDRMDTVFNANRAFVDYTIKELLNKPSDKCFISNRNLLRKLDESFCDSSKTIIIDTLKNGNTCKVSLYVGKFKVSQHQLKTNEDSSTIKIIDGQFPFGGQYGVPKIEISKIEIEINGVKLKIPEKSYKNLYYPNLCISYGFQRKVEVFESLDGEYIYIYIYGGQAAGTYFSKLIFDQKKYLTKIVSDYYPLSIHSSFRASFIGF
tara:strand:- start:29 stop:793 length:765 start_codon:yes stop_codon:yes gene_type:complete